MLVVLFQWIHLDSCHGLVLNCFSIFAVLNGSLLVVGGEDSVGDLLGVVQQYNAEEKKWTNYCDLVAPLKSEQLL